jgi:quercetin dioxygenase-like cupin family protein
MTLQSMILQTNVLAAFAAEHIVQKKVAQTDQMEVQLVCLDTGQFYPVHAPASDTVLIVWEGRADLILGDQSTHMATGHIVTVPRGVRRGFQARTKLIVFMVHSPPLTEAERTEVERLLQRGEFP